MEEQAIKPAKLPLTATCIPQASRLSSTNIPTLSDSGELTTRASQGRSPPPSRWPHPSQARTTAIKRPTLTIERPHPCATHLSMPPAKAYFRKAKYGLLPPVDLLPVREQLRAAHHFQNQLVALERCRRDVYRKLRIECCPAVAAAEVEAAIVRSELAATRRELTHVRADDAAQLRAQAKADRQRLASALNTLRSTYSEAARVPEFVERAAELAQRAKRWEAALRATSGAYWQNYLLVYERTFKSFRSSSDPQFRAARGTERSKREAGWLGDGAIGVRIPNGLTVDQLFGGKDSRLRIDRIPQDAWTSPSLSTRRRLAKTNLRIRIGTGPSKKPLWAVFPLYMHRALPADALVKRASVHVRTRGTREEWTLVLTYACAPPLPTSPSLPTPTVALDLGWRQREEEALRVAYWVDSSGGHGELLMPAEVRLRLSVADKLRALQERLFNRTMRWLKRWMQAAQRSGLAVPPGVLSASQFRSAGTLRKLVFFQWRSARFTGDDRIFAMLLRWAHRSRHLWQWETGARCSALNLRLNTYRCFAASLVRRYSTVVVERFDLARASRRAPPEEADRLPQRVRSTLVQCAPGEFRVAVLSTASRLGRNVVSVAARGSTQNCSACGTLCAWVPARSLKHTCEHCGVTWDQDYNAAKNLLDEHLHSAAT